MKRRSLKLLGMALVGALLLTACGGGKTEEKSDAQKTEDKPAAAMNVATPQVNRIVTYTQSEPGALDPAKAQGTHESYPLQHLFVGLTRNASNGKTENALADKIDVSEDGLVYTITLKDGLKWSNGEPLTAQDFEFSWKRVLEPEIASEYAYQLYYIKGAQEFNEGKGKKEDVAVVAKDDKTLEVTLKAPTAYFNNLLAFYTYYPVSKKVVEANPDWAKDTTNYVSNGPFTLSKWEHSAKLSFEKNPNYFDAANVKIDGIDMDIIEDQSTAYQKYAAGEYNFLYELPLQVIGQMKAENSPELSITNDLAVYYYNINPNIKPLNNVKVRKALAYAMDRKIIVENITKAGQTPATGYVPTGILDDKDMDFTKANEGMVKTDLEEAKKLLAEGLAEENMTPADVKVTLLYNTSENHKAISQAVQQMWNKELGINVELENVEFKVKIDREHNLDYDISRAGWVADYQDPMTFLDMFTTGNSQNNVGYAKPEYDALVKKAQNSIDKKERMDAMKAAEKMLLDDMAIIPVYYYTRAVATKPNVTGIYKPSVNEPILTYAEVKLDK